MSNHDSNHSSKEKTILWIIIPATVLVSLLFTKLNHQMVPLREALSAETGAVKATHQAAPAPSHEPEHMVAADTLQTDTVHVAPAH